MDKLIFLDIDGVLNSERWFQSEDYKTLKASFKEALSFRPEDRDDEYYSAVLKTTHIDPTCLEHLNTILKATDAKLVISSTWRVADFTMAALAQCGIDKWKERLLGVTRASRKDSSRGDEIQDWLTDNNYKGRFAILDDWYPQEFSNLSAHFFQTNWGVGLTETTAKEVIEYLCSRPL